MLQPANKGSVCPTCHGSKQVVSESKTVITHTDGRVETKTVPVYATCPTCHGRDANRGGYQTK